MGAKTILEKQLTEEILNLPLLESGTEEKSKAVNDVEKLYKLKLEEEKVEREAKFESEKTEREAKLFKSQMADKVINIFSIVAPLGVYIVLCCKGFEFEETGSFTSDIFKDVRGHVSKFLKR